MCQSQKTVYFISLHQIVLKNEKKATIGMPKVVNLPNFPLLVIYNGAQIKWNCI